LLEDALEEGALMAAEGCEPSHLDEIGNGRAVVLLDPAIELDKRTAERTGETAAQGRFTGAAQADERDAAAPIDRRILACAAFDQRGERGKFRNRYPPENIENVGHRGGAAVAAREQFDDRHVERARNGGEDNHRR